MLQLFCFIHQLYYCCCTSGGNGDGHFEINPQTGQLSCTDLDRETKAEYNLTISAFDAGSPPRHSPCQVKKPLFLVKTILN